MLWFLVFRGIASPDSGVLDRHESLHLAAVGRIFHVERARCGRDLRPRFLHAVLFGHQVISIPVPYTDLAAGLRSVLTFHGPVAAFLAVPPEDAVGGKLARGIGGLVIVI